MTINLDNVFDKDIGYIYLNISKKDIKIIKKIIMNNFNNIIKRNNNSKKKNYISKLLKLFRYY